MSAALDQALSAGLRQGEAEPNALAGEPRADLGETRSLAIQGLDVAGQKPPQTQQGRTPPGDQERLRWLAAPLWTSAETIVRTDSSAAVTEQADQLARDVFDRIDGRLVRQSFAYVMTDSARTMEYFFARLFAGSPEIRSIFPLSMAETRAAVFDGLARLIWLIDRPAEFDEALRRIARGHRKFGVRQKHFTLFLDALVATIEQVSETHWTPLAAAAWSALVGHMTAVLQDATQQDQRSRPPWWISEIVRHDRRSATVAVLTVRPDQELQFRPGQFVAVQVPRWPRIWRWYSIASAPRDDGLLDLHVRAVPGGMVSPVLVSQVSEGDLIVMGGPDGDLALPADAGRDLVCVAAGTGLAPVKSIIAERASEPGRHAGRLTLYLGGRDEEDFYDMPDLLALQAACAGLTIIPVAQQEPAGPETAPPLIRAVRAHRSFDGCEVLVSGPAALIEDVTAMLAGQVPAGAVHADPVGRLTRARGGRGQADAGPPRW